MTKSKKSALLGFGLGAALSGGVVWWIMNQRAIAAASGTTFSITRMFG